MATSPQSSISGHRAAETMVSTTTCRLPTKTRPSDDHKQNSTFLGLPPELRNAIYEHVFTTLGYSGLKPHPLSRVNQQIRRESLAMYYSCVSHLDIPLRTLEEIGRVRNWLAEADVGLYSMFPDIQLSPPKHFEPITSIRCSREEGRLLRDRFRDLNKRRRDRHRHRHETMRRMYELSLGVFLTARTRIAQPTERFMKAVREDETWNFRRVAYTYSHYTPSFKKERHQLYDMFFKLAVSKDGRLWDKSDLEMIVGFFEKILQDEESKDS